MNQNLLLLIRENKTNNQKGTFPMPNSITQNAKFRQSLIKFSETYGVTRASRKYNKSRSYIYFWKNRYDGTLESLEEFSRRPKHHPNEHSPEEIDMILRYRKRNPTIGIVDLWAKLREIGYKRRVETLYRVLKRMNKLPEVQEKRNKYTPKPYEKMTHPGERIQIDVKVVPKNCYQGLYETGERLYQYTAIDEYSRMRYLGAYPEQSTYSSSDFLKKVVKFFRRKGVKIEGVQTDNGFEFTNRFSNSKKDLKTLFEKTAEELGIRHKLIKPYTPRHNGKVERSHREDHKRFYSTHLFYSLEDFGMQLAAYQIKSNNRLMRPLKYNSPNQYLREFFYQHTVQYD